MRNTYARQGLAEMIRNLRWSIRYNRDVARNFPSLAAEFRASNFEQELMIQSLRNYGKSYLPK